VIEGVKPIMRGVTSFQIDDDVLIVDGVRISLTLLPQMIYELAHPDPRKWYRLERIDNNIIVHMRITEDVDPLTAPPIATIGE
jgi:hypothetical protein